MLRYALRFILGIFAIYFLSTSSQAADADQSATVTKFFGKAQIFSKPSAKKQGSPPHVLFDGLYYSTEPVKIGSKVDLNSVVQTAEKAMVRLVYPNGDQIMVSASSSYKMSKGQGVDKDKPVSDLLYGKFRAVISKEGPRKNLEVRTRSMVMGIRGTDFFVSAIDDKGATAVTVLRGAVAVAGKAEGSAAAAPPVEVKSGFSASIALPSTPPTSPLGATASPPPTQGISLAVTDKQDLQSIKESVSFKKSDKPDPTSDLNPELQKTLARLEEQAVATTKEDIKTSDPELYQKIAEAEKSGKTIASADALEAVTLEKAILKAPELNTEKLEILAKEELEREKTEVKKPKVKEIEDLDGDIYDKYFK